jgi:hypothetical protein
MGGRGRTTREPATEVETCRKDRAWVDEAKSSVGEVIAPLKRLRRGSAYL